VSVSYDPAIALSGDGPPLVLVPGMDGTGQLFHRQVPLLARRYRVATYRLREDAPGMSVLVDDLAAVIRTTSPEPAVVVGESFGGTVALSLALARPELVRRLVVINSFPYFKPRARLRLAIALLESVPFPWQAMGVVRRLTAFRLHSRYTHRREIRRFMELTAGTTRRGYLHRLRILLDYDVRDRLHEIAAPTLFLASERDHLVPAVEQAREMAARVPGAVVRVLAGHGHICLIAPNIDLEEILRNHEPAPTA
jgi:pimeloyl-ACP methyl ester carboxylesterase